MVSIDKTTVSLINWVMQSKTIMRGIFRPIKCAESKNPDKWEFLYLHNFFLQNMKK